MRLRKAALLIISALLFISIIGLSLHLSRISTQEKKRIYYLPSLEYLKLTSGTFRPLFAQMLFIKAILELSEEVPDRMDYLLSLFKAAINLDPKLINAYFLGGVVLPVKQEEIPLSIRFLKEGMKVNPSNWRIPFWIGFDYLQLGAYSKVIEYYRIASNLPDSPSYLKSNLAFLYYKAGKPGEGSLYLEGLLDSIKDERLLEIMETKIKWLKGLVFLEAKVEEYRRAYGAWPLDLEGLLEKDLLDEIPQDPFGEGYYLEKDLFEGIPRVRSRF